MWHKVGFSMEYPSTYIRASGQKLTSPRNYGIGYIALSIFLSRVSVPNRGIGFLVLSILSAESLSVDRTPTELHSARRQGTVTRQTVDFLNATGLYLPSRHTVDVMSRSSLV